MFILVFIRYFSGAILPEKCCRKRGFGKKYKKKGDGHIWGDVYRRGGGSNPLHTMAYYRL